MREGRILRQDFWKLICSVFMMLAALVLVWQFSAPMPSAPQAAGIAAIEGLQLEEAAERQAAAGLEDNRVYVPEFSALYMKAGRNLDVSLTNPMANPCYFSYRLEIAGEVLFQSGLIAPGASISSARLNRPLQAGQYSAELVVTTYDLENYAVLENTQMQVSLTVQ